MVSSKSVKVTKLCLASTTEISALSLGLSVSLEISLSFPCLWRRLSSRSSWRQLWCLGVVRELSQQGCKLSKNKNFYRTRKRGCERNFKYVGTQERVFGYISVVRGNVTECSCPHYLYVIGKQPTVDFSHQGIQGSLSFKNPNPRFWGKWKHTFRMCMYGILHKYVILLVLFQ